MLRRKLIAVLTALFTTAVPLISELPIITNSIAETAETTPVSVLSGDVNMNGTVEGEDLQLLQAHLLGSEPLSVEQDEYADMNGDGVVDSFDTVLLRQSLSRIIGLESYSGLVINEVCSSNKESVTDAAGASPDWMELYNGSDEDLILDGIGVSDGAKNKFKFAFPEGTIIPADSYILIYCDDAINQAEGEYHAAFKISAVGETIYLTHPEYGEIDSVAVPELDSDVAYGRYANGSENFTYLSTTPGATNNTATDLQIVEKPLFSVEGGFYDTAFALALSDNNGNEIYYTTDGSDPTTSETAILYDGEINIYNNTSDPNVYSALTDITLSEYYAPNYNVDKGIIIRAASKNADGKFSAVVTNGYYIGKTASYYNDMKVVSLSTDGDYLFNEDTGFYMVGSTYHDMVASGEFTPLNDNNDTANPTNYNIEGREAEFPVNIQVYESGKLAYTADVGARITGNWSRGYAQKSIRLYARSEYGDSKMKYAFIDELTDENGALIEEFDKITIRNGGTDNQVLHFRDIFLQELCQDRAVDIQSGEPCILFIDGEYWGFYFLRERIDADYIESHYGIDKNDVSMLKNGAIEEGPDTIAAEYQEFLDWAASADMTVEENYQKVCDTIDIQSFMDYITIETYINNADWATSYMNNWQIWRSNVIDPNIPAADGKWRFMLYDLDFTADWFEHSGTQAGFDSLSSLCMNDEPYNFIPMFYNLINNTTFRDQFRATYIEIMDNNFDVAAIDAKITEYRTAYETAIRDTNTRFSQNWVNTNYDDEIEKFRQYFIDRRIYAKYYLDVFMGEKEFVFGENILSSVSSWTHYGAGSFSYNTAENSFTANITTECTNLWDIQAQVRNLYLENGKVYRLTFEASCTNPVKLDFGIIRQVGNSYPGLFYGNMQLTPEFTEYSCNISMTDVTSDSWFLYFNYGGGTGTYTIRNVKLCEVECDTNMINGISSWSMYNPTGEGILTAHDANNITVETVTLPDNNWEVQALYDGLVLQKGKTYTYSFTVESDKATDIRVQVQQNYGDYLSYDGHLISADTTAGDYTYEFTPTENCYDASICFNCGYTESTVNISNISISPK